MDAHAADRALRTVAAATPWCASGPAEISKSASLRSTHRMARPSRAVPTTSTRCELEAGFVEPGEGGAYIVVGDFLDIYPDRVHILIMQHHDTSCALFTGVQTRAHAAGRALRSVTSLSRTGVHRAEQRAMGRDEWCCFFRWTRFYTRRGLIAIHARSWLARRSSWTSSRCHCAALTRFFAWRDRRIRVWSRPRSC